MVRNRSIRIVTNLGGGLCGVKLPKMFFTEFFTVIVNQSEFEILIFEASASIAGLDVFLIFW